MAVANNRLLALDILRGLTIAGMILVNNPGSWKYMYAPFRHAEWNGLTPTDLVFPFFMFIMGISTYISLQKYDFACHPQVVIKILKRSALIFLIGLSVGWFSRFCFYWSREATDLDFLQRLWQAVWSFDRLRILGVMPRLALCYGTAAILALTVNHRRIPWLIACILGGYFVLLSLGNGFAYDETNLLSIVDRAVLTPAHMYSDNGIDPEGVLSTLPSVAHVLLGFWVGGLLMNAREEHPGELNPLLVRLFLVGTVLTFTGFLLAYGCPINKKVWSPTFVLTTCGLGASFLALLIWLIDVKGYKRWTRFFEVFGVNPLFMYVLGAVCTILMGSVRFPYEEGSISLQGFVYQNILVPLLGDLPGSLAYSVLFLALNWAIGYRLYKRGIYLKI